MKNRFNPARFVFGFVLVLLSVIASNYLTSQKFESTPRWLDSLNDKPEGFVNQHFFDFLENQDTIVLPPPSYLPEHQDQWKPLILHSQKQTSVSGTTPAVAPTINVFSPRHPFSKPPQVDTNHVVPLSPLKTTN